MKTQHINQMNFGLIDTRRLAESVEGLNNSLALSAGKLWPQVKVSRNGPERRSGKTIIAGTAFRLEFLVGWYYDAVATTVVPELY